jgi:hypothetical protein
LIISSFSHWFGAIVATSLRVNDKSPCHANVPDARTSCEGPGASAASTAASCSAVRGAVRAASKAATSSSSASSAGVSADGRRFSSASARTLISSMSLETSSSRALNAGSPSRAARDAAASTSTPRVCRGLNAD